jgi:hypothetical protein
MLATLFSEHDKISGIYTPKNSGLLQLLCYLYPCSQLKFCKSRQNIKFKGIFKLKISLKISIITTPDFYSSKNSTLNHTMKLDMIKKLIGTNLCIAIIAKN